MDIAYSVTPLRQNYDWSCWATVTAMLYSYKYPGTLWSDQSIAEQLGGAFIDFLATGLPRSQAQAFLSAMNLSAAPPQNPSVQAWSDLMTTGGPLAVVIAENGPNLARHAIVVCGMTGDESPEGTTVTAIDPSDGLTAQLTFADFVQRYELAINYPEQIWYL